MSTIVEQATRTQLQNLDSVPSIGQILNGEATSESSYQQLGPHIEVSPVDFLKIELSSLLNKNGVQTDSLDAMFKSLGELTTSELLSLHTSMTDLDILLGGAKRSSILKAVIEIDPIEALLTDNLKKSPQGRLTLFTHLLHTWIFLSATKQYLFANFGLTETKKKIMDEEEQISFTQNYGINRRKIDGEYDRYLKLIEESIGELVKNTKVVTSPQKIHAHTA